MDKSSRMARMVGWSLLAVALAAGGAGAATTSTFRDGSWHDADAGSTPWDNGVPGPGDTAIVSHNVAREQAPSAPAETVIGSLVLQGGSLTRSGGAEPLRTTGQSTMGGGTLGDTVTFDQGIAFEGAGEMNLVGADLTLKGISQQSASVDVGVGASTHIDVQGTLAFETGFGLMPVAMGSGFDPYVDNHGTVTKTGTGTATIGVTFNNFADAGGLVEVDEGLLEIQGGGTLKGGTFNVAAGAALDFPESASTRKWAGTFTGTGPGIVTHSGGTTFAGVGTVDDPKTILDFPDDCFTWSGGAFIGLRNEGTVTLDGTPTVGTLDDPGTLTNAGTLVLAGDVLYMARQSILTNEQTGLLLITGEGDILLTTPDNGGFMPKLDNKGTIRKTGAGVSEVGEGLYFLVSQSFADIDVRAGTLRIRTPDVQTVQSGELKAGSWSIADGAALEMPGVDITVNGAVVTLEGPGAPCPALDALNYNLSLLQYRGGRGASSSSGFTNFGILAMTGTLDLTGGSLPYKQTAGGTQLGGSIDGNVQITGGSLSGWAEATSSRGPTPTDTGIGTVTGNLEIGAKGTLLTDVRGPVPGATGHDQIVVGGDATIGGTLRFDMHDTGFASPTDIHFLDVAGTTTGSPKVVIVNLPAGLGWSLDLQAGVLRIDVPGDLMALE